jgi:hypothetical protein
MLGHRAPILTRRRFALVFGMVATAGILSFILLSNSAGSAAKANTPSPYAAYPALNSTEPSGIALIAQHVRGPGGPTEPTFPAELPPEPEAAANFPIASSIRRVTVGVPGVSAWIAKSTASGVCVLVWDGLAKDGIGFACSPAGRIDHGATLELPEDPSLPGKVLRVGVVPSGTAAVTTTLADGSTESTPVTGNAWAHVTDANQGPVSTTAVGD